MNCTTCGTKIVIAEAEFRAEVPNVAELSFTVVHYCEKCGLIYDASVCPHHRVCNWPEIEIGKKADQPCRHYAREEINLVLDGQTPPVLHCKDCGLVWQENKEGKI